MAITVEAGARLGRSSFSDPAPGGVAHTDPEGYGMTKNSIREWAFAPPRAEPWMWVALGTFTIVGYIHSAEFRSDGATDTRTLLRGARSVADRARGLLWQACPVGKSYHIDDVDYGISDARAGQITTMVTRFNQFRPNGADPFEFVDGQLYYPSDFAALVKAGYCGDADLTNQVDAGRGWIWNHTSRKFRSEPRPPRNPPLYIDGDPHIRAMENAEYARAASLTTLVKRYNELLPNGAQPIALEDGRVYHTQDLAPIVSTPRGAQETLVNAVDARRGWLWSSNTQRFVPTYKPNLRRIDEEAPQ
ncbi:MAG: hypothetical protein U0625_13580 [Phycisphaerales bacterium]